MPRTAADRRQLYRATSAFSVFRDGRPVVYRADDEVLEDDPILKTHRDYFEPATERVARRSQVERATAAPGELRAPVLPPITDEETSDG